MSKGSGGGGGGTQEVVQTTTNLPEYARPYFEEMLGRTMYETTRPYEAYTASRLADFDPYETRAMEGFAEMQAPGQIATATDIAEDIGEGPARSGFDFATGFDPTLVSSQYEAGGFDPGYTARRVRPGYTARDLESQYAGDINIGPGFEAGTIADAETLEQYMNPYQQLVTDIEKREAQRASDIQAADISQQAAQAGGLGGYREAILQSERERNLGQQLQDIQARGGQAAYEQALQAFEADRAARLQEAQFGLTAGQTEDQARQEAERLRQSAFQTTEQFRQQQESFNQQAFQIGEAARQEAARLGLTAQQAEDAARQAENQFRMEAERANIAAEESRAQLGLEGLGLDQRDRQQQLEAARVLGALGGQQQRMDIERLLNLQTAGQIRRELGQRGLDIGYQDFLRQQAFPREQLAYFSNILRGLPITPGTTTASFGQAPGFAQQALGAGIGGVGLYRALGG